MSWPWSYENLIRSASRLLLYRCIHCVLQRSRGAAGRDVVPRNRQPATRRNKHNNHHVETQHPFQLRWMEVEVASVMSIDVDVVPCTSSSFVPLGSLFTWPALALDLQQVPQRCYRVVERPKFLRCNFVICGNFATIFWINGRRSVMLVRRENQYKKFRYDCFYIFRQTLICLNICVEWHG